MSGLLAPAGPSGPAPLSSKLILAGRTDTSIQGHLTRDTRLRLPQAALRAAEPSGIAVVCHFLNSVRAFVKMTIGLGSHSLTGRDAFRHDGLCGRTDTVIVSGCPHTVPHGPLWVSC